jgi:hypothetical protein
MHYKILFSTYLLIWAIRMFSLTPTIGKPRVYTSLSFSFDFLCNW